VGDATNIWMETKRLLVVFPYRNDEYFRQYRLALDALLNDSNVVSVNIIVTLPKEIKKENLQQHKLIHYVSPKDFSLFKKIKDELLLTALVQPYDILVWLESNDEKIAKLLSKLYVKRKIGVNTELDLFSIRVVCPSENPSEILNFAKHTLEKISG
jgi:hypothetical protein